MMGCPNCEDPIISEPSEGVGGKLLMAVSSFFPVASL